MKIVAADIETTLIPKQGHAGVDRIWCVVTQEEDKQPQVWTKDNWDALKDYERTVDLWVFHNGLGFDVPVLNRLLGLGLDARRVVDTLVVSRLVCYSRYSSHSLDAWGDRLGYPKIKFHDFSALTEEMITYCKRDVEITWKIFNKFKPYIFDSKWTRAMRLEHDMAMVNAQMSANGFMFNVDKAEAMLAEIKDGLARLEQEIRDAWPDELQEVRRIKLRRKADGKLYKNCIETLQEYPHSQMVGDEIIVREFVSFNPGSPKQRIEKLWEAGWKPWDKTKSHAKFARAKPGEMWGKTRLTAQDCKEKREHFAFYGWKVNEDNLATLPEDAPEAAQRLSEWLCLEGRRSSLVEWIECVADDGRIHGTFHGIGAWTGRMSHSNPNQANIFSPFHGEPKNAVERIKAKYDRDLRALWCTDKVLVGTDAEAIQLRILAHYMRSDVYRDAILTGRKEDETDIHNVNKRALGLKHLTRDHAKTFIYAWLLGASTGKIGSILKCTGPQAKIAVDNFLTSLPELKRVKNSVIPLDAKRAYFTGLDGRKVLQDSEHLMLAGYLQNGEAIAMKAWILKWTRMMEERGVWYRLVDFVHDEVQVEVENEDDAKVLLEVQAEAMSLVSKDLDLFCPLGVEGNVGKNWAETH